MMKVSVVFALLVPLMGWDLVEGFSVGSVASMSQQRGSFQTSLNAKSNKVEEVAKTALPSMPSLGGEGGYSPETLGLGLLGAFAVATFSMRQDKDEREASQSSSSLFGGGGKRIDVSIPYDAAARLAFKEFQADGQHKEANFDEFNALYKEKTVAEVVAKKKARELEQLG